MLKQSRYFMLLFLFIFIFTGCGKSSEKESGTQSESLSYAAEEVTVSDGFGMEMMSYSYVNDESYFIGTSADQKEKNKVIEIFNMITRKTDEITCDGLKSGETVLAFEKKETGGYFLLLQKSQTYRILSLAEDGSVNQEVALDYEGYVSGKPQFDKNGNLYMAAAEEVNGENYLLYFQNDGTLKGKTELEYDTLFDAICFKDDKIFCTYRKIEEPLTVYEYSCSDLKKENSKKEISPVLHQTDIIMRGSVEMIPCYDEESEFDFYFNDYSNMYGYSLETEKTEQLFRWTDCGLNININTEKGMTAFSQNCFGVLFQDDQKEPVFYLLSEQNGSSSRIQLTFAMPYGFDTALNDMILDFNKKQEDIQILIKDYTRSDDPVQAMHEDIISGNVPDIIDVTELNAETYIKKDMLVDLTPYLQEDSEISEDDFLDNILETLKVNGKLYYIPAVFQINVLFGSHESIQGRTTWNIKEFCDMYNNRKKNTMLFGYVDRLELLGEICLPQLDNIVDRETGICNFKTEGFQTLLESLSEISEEDGLTEYEITGKLKEEGSILLTKYTMSDFGAYELYQTLYQDMEIIGYPAEEGNGITAETSNLFSITTSCKEKEAAYTFLREFWDYEYQKSQIPFGFPTRKDALDMKFKQALAEKSYEDENGETVEPSMHSGSLGIDDVTVAYQPLKEEDEEKIRYLLENVDRFDFSGSSDEKIISIIEEEAEAYFQGDKSLEETTDIIENRVKLYMSETS